MFTNSEIEAVHDEIRRQISLLKNKPASNIVTESVQPAAKKSKVDFSEWCDISENVGFDSEIALYIHRLCVPGETDDLLLWWKQHENAYPNLSKLAKKYLNIPASSASSERNFSAAGLVLSERTRLSPENVDSILFLHDSLYREK
jgi:hypothetical protein